MMDSAELLALIAESSSSGERPAAAVADAEPLSAAELSELFRSVGAVDDDDDDDGDDGDDRGSRAGKLPRSVGRALKPKRPPSSYSNKSRDGRREELAYLRKSVADLEARLESLLEAAAEAAAAASFSPEASAALVVAAAKTRAVESATAQALSSGDNALWREIARRQGDERTKSERENVRLKLVLESQLKVARSLERFLQLKASATTTEIAKCVDVRRDPARLPQSLQAAVDGSPDGDRYFETDAGIFQALLTGVQQSLTDVDAVYEAKGLAAMTTSGITAQMQIDPDSGMRVEVCGTKVLPFGIHETAAAVWNHCLFAKQRIPTRYYSRYSYKSIDATEDTVVEDFTLEVLAKNTRGRFRMRQMMRRSVEADRIVIVWWSFVDPIELSKEQLSGARLLEKGYIVIKKSVTPTGTPCTLLQPCFIISPHGSGESDTGSAVGTITDFWLSATAAYIATTHQMVENVLMEQRALR